MRNPSLVPVDLVRKGPSGYFNWRRRHPDAPMLGPDSESHDRATEPAPIAREGAAVMSPFRITLLLLRSFPRANVFLLARLAGASESNVKLVLVELQTQGLATSEGDRWALTAQGVAACRPQHRARPATILRYHKPVGPREARLARSVRLTRR